jgi:16S rRNA (guanine(1405)-N(7))-methyltransferase
MDQHQPERLIAGIKSKKELRSLSLEFVRQQVDLFFRQNPKLLPYLNNPRSEKYKLIIKSVRQKLRRSYGLFRQEEDTSLLSSLVTKLNQSPLVYREILKIHSSTRERMPYYPSLYRSIFKITKIPSSIMDLGCGLNPYSIPYYLSSLRSKKLDYYAYDLSEEEISCLNEYFSFLHQQAPNFVGQAQILNLLHSDLTALPKSDVCFLFKMTDHLDLGKGHKATEKVLLSLPARFIVISFATKTMSGKSMTAPRRRWMEWLCQRLGYHYHLIEFPDEIFYVIEKG